MDLNGGACAPSIVTGRNGPLCRKIPKESGKERERVNCHSLIEALSLIIVDIETLLDHPNPSSLDFGSRISSAYMEDGVLPDVDWNNMSPRMKKILVRLFALF